VAAPRPAGRSPLIAWGAGLVGALVAMALAAPLLAPYPPHEQLDAAGGRYRPPGTALAAVRLADGRWLLAERARRVAGGLEIERRGRLETLPAAAVANLTADGVADRRYFLLGSDRFGRDLWSRMLHGARVSLLVGCLALALALTVGVTVGGVAAVGGPFLDAVLMRTVDALLAFPQLVLALALAAFLRSTEWTLVLVLGATGWMGVSRLVRGEVRSLRERDFVLAARSIGQRPSLILLRHLLPNALAPVWVDASLRIGDIILVEAALSFLGLGVQPPTPSWGSMVAEGRSALHEAWWVAAFPGLAITLVVVAFNLLGDGLRDALDPRLAGRRPAAPDPARAAAA
jgi:peptide/nickel transport system permease protein